MKLIRVFIAAAFLPLIAWAQTPPPSSQPTDPAAASSPHQREVTKTPATEAPAGQSGKLRDASSPHQKKVLSKKKSKSKTTKPPKSDSPP